MKLRPHRKNFQKVRAIRIRRFMAMAEPTPKKILGDLIREGEAIMIYGPTGVGKTYFGLAMAAAVSCGRRFLGFAGTGEGIVVAYLDAELHTAMLRSRISQVANIERLATSNRLQILSLRHFEGSLPDIGTEAGQERVTSALRDGTKVVFLDNLNSWARSGRDDGVAWVVIEKWIRQLTFSGIAVVLIHHATKRGSPMGSVRKQGFIDALVSLTKVDSTVKGAELQVDVHFEKLRSIAADEMKPFTAALQPQSDGRLRWKNLGPPAETATRNCIRKLAKEGMSQAEIARKLKKSRSTISRALAT